MPKWVTIYLTTPIWQANRALKNEFYYFFRRAVEPVRFFFWIGLALGFADG